MFSIQIVDLILYSFWAFTFIQILYLWGLFSRFAFLSSQDRKWAKIPVSVIIVAKNEYHNLKEKLPEILEQDYPEFEVILVNDGSDDETELLLVEMKKKYPHLVPINLQDNVNFFYGKKFPLSIGIKSAKHKHLLFTDADCKTNSKYWINDMASTFDEDKDIVLGYGAYISKGGLLNKIIRFETVLTAIQYFSYALSGIPYMGVGRNLAYKKQLFLDNKGFISHLKVGSGDDDLFINQVAKAKNTSIQISPDAFTLSEPELSFKHWWGQKKRHLSTSKHYKLIHKILLGFYPISTILFYLSFALVIWFKVNPLFVFIPFGFRLLSLFLIYGLSIRKLKEEKLLIWIPFLEIIYLLISPLIMLSNFLWGRKKW